MPGYGIFVVLNSIKWAEKALENFHMPKAGDARK